MNKRWVSQLGKVALVIFVAYMAIRFTIGTSFTPENFPLSKKWSVKFPGNITHLSTIGDQVVLARTVRELYALDMKSGNILWHHDLEWNGIATGPVFAESNKVFLVDGNGVLALNQPDGSILWQRPAYYRGAGAVVDIAPNVIAVNYAPYLCVYDATNGALLWSKPVDRNDVQPYFYGTNIYVPSQGIRAVDISSGEDVWEIKSDKRIWWAAYGDGVIYYSRNKLTIVAFDLSRRTEIWEIPLPNEGVTQFKVIGDLLFLTDSNNFCALQRKDGRILWCVNSRNNPQNPAVVGNVAYIFNGSQKVITAVDISSGNKIGQLTMTNFNAFTIYRQLMVSPGNELIFASGHEVFAFDQ